MIYQINTSIKERIVSSIKNGLYETQSKYNSGSDSFKNARHFVKMDDIANNIVESFESNYDFQIIKFPRGSYKLPLLYDKTKNIIYSFMSSSKFKELIDRKDHSHVHYFDVFVTFNKKLSIKKRQLALFENLHETNLHKINNVKNQLVQMIGREPKKYITIVFDMDGFRLLSVEAVLTSEYMEIAYKEDWSDFIKIDYNDLAYEDEEELDDFDELPISIKPDIARNDDISEEHITPKVYKKENKS